LAVDKVNESSFGQPVARKQINTNARMNGTLSGVDRRILAGHNRSHACGDSRTHVDLEV
jgi:hypothetical protein